MAETGFHLFLTVASLYLAILTLYHAILRKKSGLQEFFFAITFFYSVAETGFHKKISAVESRNILFDSLA